jgi:hypothetical protein
VDVDAKTSPADNTIIAIAVWIALAIKMYLEQYVL